MRLCTYDDVCPNGEMNALPLVFAISQTNTQTPCSYPSPTLVLRRHAQGGECRLSQVIHVQEDRKWGEGEIQFRQRSQGLLHLQRGKDPQRGQTRGKAAHGEDSKQRHLLTYYPRETWGDYKCEAEKEWKPERCSYLNDKGYYSKKWEKGDVLVKKNAINKEMKYAQYTIKQIYASGSFGVESRDSESTTLQNERGRWIS